MKSTKSIFLCLSVAIMIFVSGMTDCSAANPPLGLDTIVYYGWNESAADPLVADISPFATASASGPVLFNTENGFDGGWMHTGENVSNMQAPLILDVNRNIEISFSFAFNENLTVMSGPSAYFLTAGPIKLGFENVGNIDSYHMLIMHNESGTKEFLNIPLNVPHEAWDGGFHHHAFKLNTETGELNYALDGNSIVVGGMDIYDPFWTTIVSGDKLIIGGHFGGTPEGLFFDELSIVESDYGYVDSALPTPPWQFANSYNGSALMKVGASTVGPDENLYVIGTVGEGSISGAGYIEDSDGYSDVFIAKIGPDGERKYSFKIGSEGDDYGRDICLDAEGNIYVACSFGGFSQVNFKGLSGTASFTDLPPTDNQDIVIVKYNHEGEYIWHTYGYSDDDSDGNSPDEGRLSIASSDEGIFVSSVCRGSVFKVQDQVEGDCQDEAVLFKLSHDGDIRWITRTSTSDDFKTAFTDIAAHGSLVYVSGTYSTDHGSSGETLSFLNAVDVEVSSLDLPADLGNEYDGFLASFEASDGANGSIAGVAHIAGSKDVIPNNIAYENGALYYAAHSKKEVLLPGSISVITDNGPDDIFIAKAHPTTLNTLQVADYDNGASRNLVADLATSSEKVYLLGNTQGDFATSVGVVNSTSFTPFVLALDLDLNENYITQATNGGDAFGVSVGDSFENIYVSGEYSGDLSFGIHALPTAIDPEDDIFIARLNCNPIVGSVRAIRNSFCDGFPDTLIIDTYFGEIDWQRWDAASSSWLNLGVHSDTLIEFSNQTEQYRVKISALASATSCASAPPVYSDPITITLVGEIMENLVYTDSDTVCEGEEGSVTGQDPNGGVEPYNYSWYSSDDGLNWTDIGVSEKDLDNTGPINSDKYFRRVVESQGCTTTSDSILFTTHTHNLAVGNDTTIAPGTSVQLSAQGASNYLWSPSASLSQASVANPIATPSVSTEYFVTMSYGPGCSKTLSQEVFLIEDCQRDLSLWTPSTTIQQDAGIINLKNFLDPIEYISGSALAYSNGMNGTELNTLGENDNSYGEFHESADSVVVELPHGVLANEQVVLFLRKSTASSSPAGDVSPGIYCSIDGVDFIPLSTPVIVNSVAIARKPFTAPMDFKYIAFSNPGGNNDFELDGLRVLYRGGLPKGKWIGPGVANDTLFDPSGQSGLVTLDYAVEQPCIDTTSRSFQVFTPTSCDAVSFTDCPSNIEMLNTSGGCQENVAYVVRAEDVCGNQCAPQELQDYTLLGDFQGHRYFISDVGYSWNEAKVEAENLGGHLATLTSPEEEEFLLSLTIENGWIGLHDTNAEGMFEWVTGEPYGSYTNWSQTPQLQPDNFSGTQDYVTINYGDDAGWDDLSGINVRRSIVEFECLVNQTEGIASDEAFPLGTTVNTYEAYFDGDLTNVVTCSFEVTIEDDMAPVIDCASTQYFDVDANTGLAEALFPYPSATDNCDETGSQNIPQHAFLGVRNGHSYYLRQTSGSWEQHRDWAIAQGGYLTTIGSAAENDWLIEHLPSNAFIGFNDYENEGDWVWANGDASAYTNWNTNLPYSEPSNHDNGGLSPGGEDGAAITFPDGEWDSWYNSTMSLAVVEFDYIYGLSITRLSGPYYSEELSAGNYTSSFVATDTFGNEDYCEINIVMQDVTPPSITCPADFTASLSSGLCEEFLDPGLPTVVENSANYTLENDFTFSDNAQGNYPLGSTVVGWTVTDVGGNMQSCSQIVTIEQGDVNLQCSNVTFEEGNLIEFVFTIEQSLCQEMSVSYFTSDSSAVEGEDYIGTSGLLTFNIGDTQASVFVSTIDDSIYEADEYLKLHFSSPDSYVIIDEGIAYARITSSDQKPVVSISDAYTLEGSAAEHTLSLSPASGEDVIVTISTADATALSPQDFEPLLSVSYVIPAGDTETTVAVPIIDDSQIEPIEEYKIDILSATGANISTTDGSAYGTIESTDRPPIFTVCAPDQTENLDTFCQYELTEDYMDMVDVTDDGTFTLSQNPSLGTTLSGAGSHTITITAIDDEGLTSECTFTLTLIDLTPPLFSNCLAPTTLSANADCEALFDLMSPSATDQCGMHGVSDIHGLAYAGAFNGHSYYTTTYSGTREALKDSASALGGYLVTIEDATENQFVQDKLGSRVAYIGLNDIDSEGNFVWQNGDPLSGYSNWDNANGHPISGSTVNAVAFNNHSGNLATWQVLSELETIQGLIEFDYVSNMEGVSNLALPVGVHNFPFWAYDNSQNESQCTISVTVNDTTDPVSTSCQGDTVVYLDNSCQYYLGDFTNLFEVSDNCTSAPLITQSPSINTLYDQHGTIVPVTLTAIDENGNSVQCVFNVTVEDNIPPTITNCPSDSAVELDENCQYIMEDFAFGLTFSDLCDSEAPSVFQTPSQGTAITGHNTTHTVTLMVDDGNGNTSSCDFELTLQDNTPPTFSCSGDISENLNSSCQFEVPNYSALASDQSDNCGLGSEFITQEPPMGTIMTSDFTVTLTLHDGRGNSSPCSFNVNLIPNSSNSLSAGADFDVCSGGAVALTAASYTGAGSILWDQTSVAGTFDDIFDINTTYYPTASEYASGSVILSVEFTGTGACAPLTDFVTINFLDGNNAGPDQSADVCKSEGVITLSDYLHSSAQSSGIWTAPAGANGFDHLTTEFDISSNPQGNYVFIYSVENNPLTCPTDQASITITIIDPAPPTGMASQAFCQSDNPRVSDLSVSAALINWYSDAAGTASLSSSENLVDGNTYYASNTEGGCESTTLLGVTVQIGNLSISETTGQITCNGAADGFVDASTSGEIGAVTYDWDHISGTDNPSNISGLSPGIYGLTVTDGLCVAQENVTISEPATVIFDADVTHVTCNGSSTGAIDINPSGGTGTFLFDWDTDGNGDFNDSEDLSALAAGTYTLIATDNNSCLYDTTIVITEQQELLFNANVTDVECSGSNTGSINISPTGGMVPFEFLWTHTASGSTFDTQDISGLEAGSYTLQITDANSCINDTLVTITEPDAVIFAATVTDVDCHGASTGAIEINPVGGTGTLSFAWTNSTTGDTYSDQNLISLAAGTYTLTATDAASCTYDTTVVVNENTALQTTTSYTSPSFNGGADGQADVEASGGVGPHTFSWSTSSVNDTIFNISSGTYFVTITDALGCSRLDSAVVTEPDEIVITETHVDASCISYNDGSIDITVTGGVSPYQFDWSDDGTGDLDDNQVRSGLTAGTYTLVVQDANLATKTLTVVIVEPNSVIFNATLTDADCNGASTGAVDISPTGGTGDYDFLWMNTVTSTTYITEDISGLAAGNYNLQISDSNSCLYDTTVTITEPAAVIFAASVTDVDCNGASTGSIDINPAGGTEPYSYDWSNNGLGVYTDTQDLTNLSAGNYTVSIQDGNSCTYDTTLVITQPQPLAYSDNTTHVDCNGEATGAIDITLTGGEAPYEYMWSAADLGANATTDEDLGGLTAGAYQVNITDANLCVLQASIDIAESDPLVLTKDSLSVSVYGASDGQASVVVSGGIAPYTYLWSNGSDQATITGQAGIYTVTVTDQLVCVKSAEVTINEPTELTVSQDGTSNTSLLCFGDANGFIALDVSGGVAPYTVDWGNDGAFVPYTNSTNWNNLSAGSYPVTLRDANGAEVSMTIDVTQPGAALVAGVISTSDVDCFGESTGVIDIDVTGGTPNYTYDWSTDGSGDFDDTQDANSLLAGVYSVEIRDQNACTTVLTDIEIQQPATPAFLTCPDDITTVTAEGQCQVAVNYLVPSSSNPSCPSSVVLISGPSSGSQFPVGETEVIYQLNNTSGDSLTSCGFTVMVNQFENEFNLSQSATTVAEESGSVDITISSTGDLCADEIIYYSLVDITANSSDYTGPTISGTTVFALGTNTVTLSIPVTNDDIVESVEKFELRLDSAQYSLVGTNNLITVSIIDNDEFSYSVSSDEVFEGETGTLSIAFDKVSDADTTFWIRTAPTVNTPASASLDYSELNMAVTLPANQSVLDIEIITIDDFIFEEQETVNLILSTTESSADILALGTLTIKSDEGLPVITVEDAIAQEEATAEIIVRLDSVSAFDIDLLYSTEQLTGPTAAVSGSDYNTVSDLAVTIPAGQDSVVLYVQTLPDEVYELEEYLQVNVSSNSLVDLFTVANAEATVTIVDDPDEELPVLTVSNSVVIEGDTAYFTVTSTGSEVDATFQYRTGLTASITENDFEHQSAPMATLITEGQSTSVIKIATTNDNLDEDIEVFEFLIQNVEHATLQSGLGTINQQIMDDGDLPQITCAQETVYLDESGNAAFLLEDLVTDDNMGTAVYWNDYTGQNSLSCDSLLIHSGSPSSITISVSNTDGETGQCEAQVTVLDNMAPVFTSLGNSSVHLTGNECEATVFIDLPAYEDNDACSQLVLENPSTGLEVTSGFDATLEVGTHSFYWQVTDDSGNESLDSTVVEVLPALNAGIDVMETINLVQTGVSCNAHVNFELQVINLCEPLVKYTINGFEQTGHQIDQSFEVGVTQVFWEVETSSGDFTAVTEVMVEDITDPVILSYGEDLDTCGLAVAYLPQSEFFDLCDSDLTIDTQVEGGQWNEELQVWNFTPGAHHVIYTASDDFGNQVVDSVLVTTNAINIPVYGVGDTSLAFVFEAQLGVLAVDDATSYSWSTNGPAVITGANTAFATVSELEFGINEFFITVNTPCGEGTDTVTVYVDDLSVPSGFSPNGDGQNDEFVIRGIENLAPNDFTVYNRWGVKVYESKDYQNDWNGTARNGNALPADTYYFILNLPDRNPYKAYIELKR